MKKFANLLNLHCIFNCPGYTSRCPAKQITDMKYNDELSPAALHDTEDGFHATLHSHPTLRSRGEGDFLMAFGPADHHFESDEDSEEACFYVLGYN
jgi:hypothetical protein